MSVLKVGFSTGSGGQEEGYLSNRGVTFLVWRHNIRRPQICHAKAVILACDDKMGRYAHPRMDMLGPKV